MKKYGVSCVCVCVRFRSHRTSHWRRAIQASKALTLGVELAAMGRSNLRSALAPQRDRANVVLSWRGGILPSNKLPEAASADKSFKAGKLPVNQKFRKGVGVGERRGLMRGDPSYGIRTSFLHNFSSTPLGRRGHNSREPFLLYFGPAGRQPLFSKPLFW